MSESLGEGEPILAKGKKQNKQISDTHVSTYLQCQYLGEKESKVSFSSATSAVRCPLFSEIESSSLWTSDRV